MKLATDGSYVILELGDKDLALTQDQILKWKEDAKMYNWAVKELGIGLSEAVHFFKEYKEDAEKWREWFDEPTTDIINDNRKIVERLKELDLSGHILFLLGHTNILPVGYDKGKLETIVYDLQGLQKSLEVKK